jgi:hypothetical protein
MIIIGAVPKDVFEYDPCFENQSFHMINTFGA